MPGIHPSNTLLRAQSTTAKPKHWLAVRLSWVVKFAAIAARFAENEGGDGVSSSKEHRRRVLAMMVCRLVWFHNISQAAVHLPGADAFGALPWRQMGERVLNPH